MSDDVKTDLFIAEKVMRWKHVKTDNFTKGAGTVYMFYKGEEVLRGKAFQTGKINYYPKGYYDHSFEKWTPTSNLAQAFEVVEQLRKHFSNFTLCGDNGWGATFWHIDVTGEEVRRIDGFGATPEAAICEAAVLCFGSPKKRKKKK